MADFANETLQFGTGFTSCYNLLTERELV